MKKQKIKQSAKKYTELECLEKKEAFPYQVHQCRPDRPPLVFHFLKRQIDSYKSI